MDIALELLLLDSLVFSLEILYGHSCLQSPESSDCNVYLHVEMHCCDNYCSVLAIASTELQIFRASNSVLLYCI
jgi:hypothetical protein